MKKIALLLTFITTLAYSQKEASIWYFGNHAGLDFNSGSPVALTDGQINTQESCGSIADSSGQLLFYTDGMSVFTRNHIVMPNGTGLLGHASSAQSGTIVPKPGSTTLFYIFTTDNEHDPNGFRYSVVDMSLNGGFGEVTTEKNILVFTPSLESIAVVKKANNIDYWIVGHGWDNNNFYAHSLTTSGLSSIPVTSSVGAVITGIGFKAAGCIKIAPSGSKLAFTSVSDIAQLFDFNSNTGVVSNPITLSTETGELNGAEFSPDESKLYIANSFYRIYQYDLTAADIPGSKITIYNGTKAPGALQLGPDGKIYIAVYGYNMLGVINNPDTLGLGCDLQISAINLGGKISSLGLPSFNRSFFDASFKADNLCLGSSTQFTLISTANVSDAVWDFGDSSPASNSINASHTYALPGTYPVSVAVSSGSGTITKSKSITISATPTMAAAIGNQSVCGAANMNYNLSQFNNTVLGSQSATVFGVAYFVLMTDVVNHSNALTGSYTLPLGTTTFFAKVYNLNNFNCYSVSSFTVTLSQQPIAIVPSDYIICENLPYDNVEVFDLTTKNSEILNGQSAAIFSISYHLSQSDANLNNAPLPTLYTNTLVQETVYVRIQNNNNPNCYITTTLLLNVVHQPQIISVSNFTLCDDTSNDGIASFDLSQKTTEILNGQSTATFEVKYYYNLTDAQNDINEITSPINNSVNNQIIYYSITAVGNVGCKSISNFILIVGRLPIANIPNAQFICDDVSNDGIGQFDLSTTGSLILGSQNATQFSVSYYLNQNDADTGLNSISLPYQNSSNPETLFARVENNQNQSCFATTSFQIGLYKMPVANQPQSIVVCDDDSNDGKELFDLSQQTGIILGSQSTSAYTVSYHVTSADALNGVNDLSAQYTNITNPQIIYVRVENNSSTTCFATTSFQLQVKPKPVIAIDDFYSICEGTPISINEPSGFSSYSWSTGSSSNNTTIANAGNYSLTVTKNYGSLICPTTEYFTVYSSGIATINSIETSEWTDNQNAIIVHLNNTEEDYDYSIDGIHFQDSTVFTNLDNGYYTVYVRSKKKCGIVTKPVYLLMYPKFFTPNGDGINDEWRVKFAEMKPNMELLIFDRYGKIITGFKGTSIGWDGTLNGKFLPADDYWFVIKQEGGVTFKGHFSLIQ